MGGSIRHPAYCCGVVGLRPTPGRVPHLFSPVAGDQPLGLQQMLVDGPIARCVDDLRLMLDAMSGFDPQSASSLPLDYRDMSAQRPFKIGLLRDDGVKDRTPTVTASLEWAAQCLRDKGLVVEEVQLPMLAEAYRLWWLLVIEETRALRPQIERDGDAAIRTWINFNYEVASEWWGRSPSLDDYMNGYARRGTLIAQLQAKLEEYPVVILPVTNEEPFLRNQYIASLDAARSAIASGWSLMGIPVLGFPAMSVPTGTVEGIPTGVQLLARRFRERDLFDIGGLLEAQTGVLTPINPRF
ncbi:MAG: amidase family protein [Dyella sp.]